MLLEQAIDKLGFSVRAFTRILKIAHTIADLEGAELIATLIFSRPSSTAAWTEEALRSGSRGALPEMIGQ